MKLGVSSYSYWHFKPERVPIEHVIEEAARLELDGVEILHQQMASEANPYLQKLKRHAFIHGLDLYALSIHQGFVSPDAATRQKKRQSHRPLYPISTRTRYPFNPSQLRDDGALSRPSTN